LELKASFMGGRYMATCVFGRKAQGRPSLGFWHKGE
jgi:hypothetical protein